MTVNKVLVLSYSPRGGNQLSSCRLSIKACFCAIVIPLRAFLIGLRFVGVFAGLLPFVGTIRGGAGKDCISIDVVESVDMRFFERVGAMLRNLYCVVWSGIGAGSDV